MADLKFGLVHSESVRLTFADFATSGNRVKFGNIPKGSLILSTHLVNVIAFTTTSLSLLVGSDGDDDQLVAAGDFGELTTGYYNATTGRGIVTTGFDLYAKATHGTVPAVGEVIVAVEYIPPSTNRQKLTIFDT